MWHKVISLLLLCSGPLCLSSAQGANLHVFIVADMHAKTLESQVAKDYDAICQEVQRIAAHTGLTLLEKHFLGKAKDPKNLLSAIELRQVAKDDVLLFYFAGHGYHQKADQVDPWPTLEFEKAKRSIALKSVIKGLEAKGARLTLIFCDCCNQIKDAKKTFAIIEKSLNFKSITEANYQKLFLKTSGLLISTSSSPGQYSASNQDGGLYTQGLINSLKEVTHSITEAVDWHIVMEKIAFFIEFKCQDFPLKQTPLYLLQYTEANF